MKIKHINGKLNIIGKNLKKYRKLRGYSQRDLCNRLELFGISMYHSDIHHIEHGGKTVRDYEIAAICKALNISLDNLFENTDKEFE